MNKSEQIVVLNIKVNRDKIAISIYTNILDRLEHILYNSRTVEKRKALMLRKNSYKPGLFWSNRHLSLLVKLSHLSQ